MSLNGSQSTFHNKAQRLVLGNHFENGKRMPGLDILRSLAILLVVISHADVYYIEKYIPKGLSDCIFRWGGFMGVEIFFVLSGFLIGRILIKIFWESPVFNFKTIKEFWIRRWFRTLPNYLLVLIVYIIINLLHGIFNFRLYAPYFVFLQNFAWVQPRFFNVSWSLAIEEWFYLLLPLVLILFYFLFSRKKKTALISTILLIVGVTFIRFFYAMQHPDADWDNNLRKVVVFRLDSLMYGVTAALIYQYRFNWWKKMPATFFAVGLVLFGVASIVLMKYIFWTDHYSVPVNVFIFSLTSFSIALVFPFMTFVQIKNHWANLFFTWISLISYSLYLIHELIINLTYSALGHPSSPGKGVFMLLAFFILSLTVATLQYRFFERPMTDMREKFHS